MQRSENTGCSPRNQASGRHLCQRAAGATGRLAAAAPSSPCFPWGVEWPDGGCPLPCDLYVVRGAQLPSLPAGMSHSVPFHCGAIGWAAVECPPGTQATSQSVHLCSRILSALPNICRPIGMFQSISTSFGKAGDSQRRLSPRSWGTLFSLVSLLDAVSAPPQTICFSAITQMAIHFSQVNPGASGGPQWTVVCEHMGERWCSSDTLLLAWWEGHLQEPCGTGLRPQKASGHLSSDGWKAQEREGGREGRKRRDETVQ